MRTSAGLLMFRLQSGVVEFLLVHPGGPFWQKKDAGAWSVPKGEIAPGEDALAGAKREFEEELGLKPEGEFIQLTPIDQKSGKCVQVWGFEGNCDPAVIRSNRFKMEWPPRSGKIQEFPEVDRAEWFTLAQARTRINPAQVALLEELERKLKSGSHGAR